MPITILSPYSGRPVKVRDQDLERALRDEQGRIFYVVEGSDGKGYYASMTRKGSEKDQQRYRKLAETGAVVDQQAKANVQQLHDATGKKRRNPTGLIILFLIGAALGFGLYAYLNHPQWLGLGDDPQPALQPGETEAEPESDDDAEAQPQSRVQPERARIYYTVNVPPVRVVPVLGNRVVFAEEPLSAEQAEQVDEADDAADPPQRGTWRPKPATDDRADQAPPPNPFADFRVTASGLRYKTTHLTDGTPALAGCYLEVRYAAYELDGTPLIDDARQKFVLMTGKAIRAMDEGLAGMREGEQRVLFVPKGHSTTGELPGIEQLPDRPFVIDVMLDAVKPGITHITEAHGEGTPAQPGDTLKLHYLAWVEGKTEPFDSSKLRGKPMTVTLGHNDVIPGLELGLSGMQPGETRLITIPPYLAYGNRETAGGLIPANSVLTFRLTAETIVRPEQAASNSAE